jgi:hypothetical protein
LKVFDAITFKFVFDNAFHPISPNRRRRRRRRRSGACYGLLLYTFEFAVTPVTLGNP